MRENIIEHLRFCATHFSCDGCVGGCVTGSNEPRTAFVLNDAADAIEELLAVVSSVVKCKECRWCHSGYCEKYDDLIPFGCANKPWEDWFCADGKRPEPPKEDAE